MLKRGMWIRNGRRMGLLLVTCVLLVLLVCLVRVLISLMLDGLLMMGCVKVLKFIGRRLVELVGMVSSLMWLLIGVLVIGDGRVMLYGR